MIKEVVAENLRLRLQFPVNATVPLLHPAWVPRHVEVEQVLAVSLKVKTFASRISGDQDSKRVLGRIGVKCVLNRFTLVGRGGAMEDSDSVVGAFGSLNCGRELFLYK